MRIRHKLITSVLVLIAALLPWQVFALFGSSSASTPAAASSSTPKPSTIPKPATLPPQDQMATTPLEAELMKAQQELQTKYVAALNELQMLKITRDIANASNDIITAKLNAVTTEKKIVDLLAPPPPPMMGPGAAGGPSPSQPQLDYSVVSISQLQNKWGAVLALGTTLYAVHAGDTLPDRSKVVSIERSRVVLDRYGEHVTYTLIPPI